jgi:Protein of unknown function (DUF1573)
MMRWILLAVVVVMISAMATFAVQYFAPDDLGTPVPAPRAPEAEAGPPPAAVVEGDLVHHFGVMAQQTHGEKVWVIRNAGPGVLKLTKGTSSCSCTIADLGEGGLKRVEPDQTTTVRLTWDTKQNRGKFGQSATILTNDPEHPELKFQIEGEVQPPILTVPEALEFAGVAVEQAHRRSFALYSPDKPDLVIQPPTSSRPEFLGATVTPLTDPDRQALGIKQGGYRVDVELKPGMPLGTFREELAIATDHMAQREVRLLVTGNVVGPISAVPEAVRLPGVPGHRGQVAAVTLCVRGQESTRFDLAKIPEKLKVQVAPVDEKAQAADATVKLRKYRMTVTVPPGTAPGVIAGPIVLKTDHPQAGEVKIPVHVVVLGAG